MKDNVFNQCTAETFEEAYKVDKIRLANERREAADLAAAMKADGESTSGIEPEFWLGCEAANEQAWSIYQEEMAMLRERVAARILGSPRPSSIQGKNAEKGFDGVIAKWADALKKNQPDIVVWW